MGGNKTVKFFQAGMIRRKNNAVFCLYLTLICQVFRFDADERATKKKFLVSILFFFFRIKVMKNFFSFLSKILLENTDNYPIPIILKAERKEA